MNRTTIVLPVGREQHLHKVFASLELLKCDRERTGLFVLVDGDEALHAMTSNLVEQSKFTERLCVQGNIPGQRKEFNINTRLGVEGVRKGPVWIHGAVRQDRNALAATTRLLTHGIRRRSVTN